MSKEYGILTSQSPNAIRRQFSTNGSTLIRFPVEGTSVTLLIETIPNQKIARNDLIPTLYDTREYLRQHIKQEGDGWLTPADDPFNSTAIPNPPNANCVLRAQSNLAGKPPQHLTYQYLGDAVQGLMDYTFYPYSATMDSLAFAVIVMPWGFVGSGIMEATAAAAVAR